MCLNRPTYGRNYSGEQKVNFEPPVPFSKCLRAKIYSNTNVFFDSKGCQTLLLKESEPLLFTLGSWTIRLVFRLVKSYARQASHKTKYSENWLEISLSRPQHHHRFYKCLDGQRNVTKQGIRPRWESSCITYFAAACSKARQQHILT